MMDCAIPQKHLSEARDYARAYAQRKGMQECDSHDIQQEATLAAFKAWGRFDDTRGVSFRTFSWQSIGGAVVRWIEQQEGRPGTARAAARHVRIDEQGQVQRG